MKTFKSFAFAVALAGLTLPMAGCSDDDTAPKGEDVERGDKACRIETFTLNFSDGTTLSGDVYDYDKSVDLSYTTAEFEMMKSATATLTLSEGATVSPDPSQTADYTQPLSFTVTAKDGKTARTYTTKPVEKVLEGYTKVEAATSKTATEMGIGTAADYKFVGVSGDKLVVGKKVFDYKTFAPAGDLNMTGYEDQKMTGMANDEAGHLIAAVNADGASAVPTTIICWKDGWDKAPSEYIKSETSFIGKDLGQRQPAGRRGYRFRDERVRSKGSAFRLGPPRRRVASGDSVLRRGNQRTLERRQLVADDLGLLGRPAGNLVRL